MCKNEDLSVTISLCETKDRGILLGTHVNVKKNHR